MYKCTICDKEFDNVRKFNGHKSAHRTNHIIYCSCILTRVEMKSCDLLKYQSKLRPCENCGTLFKKIQSGKSFCSRSCATSITNQKRGNRSDETKKKISESLYRTNKRIKNEKVMNKQYTTKFSSYQHTKPIGPYSKLYKCACKHCGVINISRQRKKYCFKCNDHYGAPNRTRYKFTFNVYNYPDIFDLKLLNQIGWYSPGGKKKGWNPEGLARDHKISVNDAILNSYDPFYITHPLNCQLITQIENNAKKAQSVITYEYLKEIVDEYEKKKAAI